ncbi:hypothetical protein JCM8202_003212 [Rhodotorula sphaerocarpa]
MSSNVDAHVKRGHIISFSLLTVFSCIAWIIAAALVSYWNGSSSYPSGSEGVRIRFLLFVGLWTFIFSLVYIVGFLVAASSFIFSIASHVVFLFITWVFWLSGTAAFASSLGGSLDCSYYTGPYCTQQNALEAFGWICFILTTFMLVGAIMVGAKSARSGNGFGGSLIQA